MEQDQRGPDREPVVEWAVAAWGKDKGADEWVDLRWDLAAIAYVPNAVKQCRTNRACPATK